MRRRRIARELESGTVLKQKTIKTPKERKESLPHS